MDLQELKTAITFLDANLFRTLIASAFGTFAGAWLASRAQTKKAIVTELNAIAAADMLAIQIANSHLALKRQYVKPIYDEYEQLKNNYESYRKSRATGGARVAFSYAAELRSLSPIKTPIDALEKMILDRVAIRGRGLAAVTELADSVDVLRLVIEGRNRLVEEFQTSDKTSDAKLQMLLGLRTQDGVIDERFKTNVAALFAKTDDCIFFARIFSDDLHRYAKKISKRYRWRYWLNGLSPEQADWTPVATTGLLPNEADYEPWLKGFKRKKANWRKIFSKLPPSQ
ncbi:hypothetical protein [Pseudolabrys taiwanensis]|uniref:hypothetical protein n=1 Tax=Pseudolabrys taiwanensis TaxID=331696 RepID=UPI0013B38738|nr:hypothetical protein [Pseudolabrys taiwanensis]